MMVSPVMAGHDAAGSGGIACTFVMAGPGPSHLGSRGIGFTFVMPGPDPAIYRGKTLMMIAQSNSTCSAESLCRTTAFRTAGRRS
jgi:hypothetical protein